MFKHPKDDITYERIADELQKIKDVSRGSGFLYWFVEYVYMSHPAYGQIDMATHAYKWQKKACKAFLKHQMVISKKPRQVAFSSTTAAYALYRALFFNSQNIYIVSLSLRESTEFLKRLKFIYDHLPVWQKQPKVVDMATTMTFAHNDSKITSLPMTSDVARGTSASLIVLDEFAMYKKQGSVLGSAYPALAAGALVDFSDDVLPSQLFIISTYPENPVNNEYVRLLNQAREQAEDSDFHVIEVDVSDIPHYQDEKWMKRQLDILGPKRFAIEIKGEEPIDSENALLPEHVLRKLESSPPIRCDFLHPEDVDEEGYYIDMDRFATLQENFDIDAHYIKDLWIWNDPIPGHQYALTADVAAGKMGDYSAFIVIDLETMEQVAEYRNNRIGTEAYKKIIHVVAMYYNTAKVSIENNGLGIGLCEYFDKVLNYQYFYQHRKSKHRYIVGFPMSQTTRGQALVYMQSIVGNEEIKIKSIRLINELRSFGYTPNGRIEALGNGTDDLVLSLIQMCYLIAIGWAVSDSKILETLPFGLLTGKDFDVDETENDQSPKEAKIAKYWEEKFDIEKPAFKELTDMLKATGSTLSLEEIKRLSDGV